MARLADHLHDAQAAVGRILRHQQLVLFALALVIGAMAGGGAIVFRYMIAGVQLGALGFASERVQTLAAALPWWQVLLAPAAGGLVVGLFVRYLMPGGRPQAVADVMAAAALRGGRMSLRAGLGAAAVSAVSIGSGASVGREGPVVHLGAALSSFVAQRLHLSRQLRLTLLGCGVAAAIAASFNTPIAGVLFALEVVLGHYALSSFAPIVIASVTGTVIARLHYGDYPAFIIPEHTIVSFWEFPAFALLGIVSAVVAVLFIRATFAAEDLMGRLRLPRWARPALAGLAVGAFAIEFPHLLGVGYETTDMALSDGFGLRLLIVLLVLKAAATALCLGAGFGGGVFSPSLMMGALAGSAFGIVATAAFPELSSGPGAYAIVGMGAVAGSVLGAPISTILIVFELTSNLTLTIAVMAGVVIASVITQQAAGRSFFFNQLARRGLDLGGGREAGLLRARRVADIMRDDPETIPPGLSLPAVRARLQQVPNGELFVVEEDGRLVGTIGFADLSEVAFDTSYDSLLKAVDVARLHPPALARDANLEDARKLLDTAHEERLPVVEDAESQRLIGYVYERDVMTAYNRALMQARAEERGEL